MIVEDGADLAAAGIAAAIGEPARARMLYALMDGRARTGTELAVLAGVSPSTASVHLGRLTSERLVAVAVQGRHRYYRLRGPAVARLLEGLNVLAGGDRTSFLSTTPHRLRVARTCYDHLAGSVAVALHDSFVAAAWLRPNTDGASGYDITAKGAKALEPLGIDVAALRALRRRLAYGCLDWSERLPHVGGALGAALLSLVLRKKWLIADHDGRALSLTRVGRGELKTRLGINFPT
jgi:DNA-binding transcriptional ArsR family regulator